VPRLVSNVTSSRFRDFLRISADEHRPAQLVLSRGMLTGTVYALCDPRNDAVRYVGMTLDADKRLRRHLRNADRGQDLPVYDWIHSIGEDPVVEPLELVVPEFLLAARERFWIADLRARGCSLLNATEGGDCVGGSPSASRFLGRKGGLTGVANRRRLGLKQTPPSREASGRGGRRSIGERNSEVWCCDECGQTSNCGGLGTHQRYTGHVGRSRV
jgi:hypothetical protein